jgi:hypothetical protein
MSDFIKTGIQIHIELNEENAEDEWVSLVWLREQIEKKKSKGVHLDADRISDETLDDVLSLLSEGKKK